MSNTSPKALATATVEMMRDTSRRLSADLRDMSRDLGQEFRNMGREICDIHREIGQRFRNSSLQNGPRIPRIGLSNAFGDGPQYTTIDDVVLIPDDDEEAAGANSQKLCHEEDGDRLSVASSANRLSVIRSPRTEEMLKNMGQALRKTDEAFRDMVGLGVRKNMSGMVNHNHCNRELERKVSAPPPSPSNFGL